MSNMQCNNPSCRYHSNKNFEPMRPRLHPIPRHLNETEPCCDIDPCFDEPCGPCELPRPCGPCELPRPCNLPRPFELPGPCRQFDPCEPNEYYCDDDLPERSTCISDEYLLNYLLKKYKLDKQKLIVSIQKNKDNEIKCSIMDKFYRTHHQIRNRPFREQYRIFKNWNQSEYYICQEELEDYYEKYVRYR